MTITTAADREILNAARSLTIELDRFYDPAHISRKQTGLPPFTGLLAVITMEGCESLTDRDGNAMIVKTYFYDSGMYAVTFQTPNGQYTTDLKHVPENPQAIAHEIAKDYRDNSRVDSIR